MDNDVKFFTEDEMQHLKNDTEAMNKAWEEWGKTVYNALDGALKKQHVVKIYDEPACACEDKVKNAVPVDGTLTFTGYPNEILRTLRTLLDGRKIEMTVDWTVIDK